METARLAHREIAFYPYMRKKVGNQIKKNNYFVKGLDLKRLRGVFLFAS